jgi:hypothetical protein
VQFIRTFQHLYYVFTTLEWDAPSVPTDLIVAQNDKFFRVFHSCCCAPPLWKS